jgi:purine-nucleoside phosphorylase
MGKKGMKRFEEAAGYLRKQVRATPQVGIILGSGLGNFVQQMTVEKEIAYGDIPHFPVSTVKGHSGRIVFGSISGKNVVAMAGRFHFYEGYEPPEVVFPVRVMKLLGVETLLLSNAAGAVNPDFRVGDLVIIRDHISFFTPNPLIGKNLEAFGPRFPDMGEPYRKHLIDKARVIAATHNLTLREGVYAGVTGPTFETPAEYQVIRVLGADLVGMSTVQETIAGVHMGMDVFAVSVVTDLGGGEQLHPITHEEVLEAAQAAEPSMALLFKELIAAI